MKAIIIAINPEELEYGIYLNVEEVGYFIKIRNMDGTIYKVLSRDKLIDYIPLTVCGKSYEERQNDLQNKAIEWSFASGAASWSYGELADIQEFFERNGKRYGLIREFRENGII